MKIRSEVDQARFKWLVFVIIVYYSIGTLLVNCNRFLQGD